MLCQSIQQNWNVIKKGRGSFFKQRENSINTAIRLLPRKRKKTDLNRSWFNAVNRLLYSTALICILLVRFLGVSNPQQNQKYICTTVGLQTTHLKLPLRTKRTQTTFTHQAEKHMHFVLVFWFILFCLLVFYLALANYVRIIFFFKLGHAFVNTYKQGYDCGSYF